jgi:hypothetical protein
VNPASFPCRFRDGFRRNRAHQPDPIFPQFPGIILGMPEDSLRLPEWEFATLSFPVAGIRRPWVAAGSPTLFSTASGVFGLVAGPTRALRLLVYRVRPLSSLQPVFAPPAGEPGEDTVMNESASAPCRAGSAIAVSDALAQCYGSDLLPLRLSWFTSQRFPFQGIASELEAFAECCQPRLLPAADAHFVSPLGAFRWAE